MFDRIFGLPMHPLAVHAPLVLIPIFALMAVVMVVKPTLRRRIGWFAPVGVLVMVAMLFVAKESGEALLESDPSEVFLLGSQEQITTHQDLGNATFVLGVIWLLLTVGVVARDQLQPQGVSSRALSAASVAVGADRVALVLAVLASVAGILTTIWLVRTGHAGADARWGV
jgi:hypothetical protein